jgi:hypothetical protein
MSDRSLVDHRSLTHVFVSESGRLVSERAASLPHLESTNMVQIRHFVSLQLTFGAFLKNPGFSPLEARLSTRFSVRNGKSEALAKPTVPHFFGWHQSIQLAKLYRNGARELNKKISRNIEPPYIM